MAVTLDNFSNLSQLYAAGGCLVELLSAALHGKQAPALPAGVNWEQVCRLARLHSVDTMAFSAARDRVAREDPETFRMWDRWYAQNLVQHVVQQQEIRSVCRCFYQAEIPAVPLKGAMLAGVYPRQEYRQMSDLDILIPAPAAAAGEEILLKLGYERLPEEEQTDFHTGYQKPPYMAVELHTRLLPGYDANAAYFDCAWDHVTPSGGEEDGERFSPEFFYLFMAAHMAKHFFSLGLGIRAVLDDYLFRTAYQNSLDWNWVRKELRKLGLLGYMDRVKQVGEKWFGETRPDRWPERMRRMEREIYASGTHGSGLSRLAGAMPEKEGSGGLGSAGFLFRRIFVGRQYLQSQYHILGRYPFLLPACWVHRLLRQLGPGRRVTEDLQVFSRERKETEKKENTTPTGGV